MLTEEIITEMNKKFKSSRKAEKRVLIAQDVIAMVKAGKREPKMGYYVKIRNRENFEPNESVQKINDEIECHCCALGACLLSTIKFINSVELWELSYLEANSKNMWGLLKPIFTSKQMLLIEYAFEIRKHGDRVGEKTFKKYLTEKEVELSIKFGERYESENDRLIAIMENIINNKGTFMVK